MTTNIQGISQFTTVASTAVAGACTFFNSPRLQKLKKIAGGIAIAGALITGCLYATKTFTAKVPESVVQPIPTPLPSTAKTSWSKDPFLCRIRSDHGAQIEKAIQTHRANASIHLEALQLRDWNHIGSQPIDVMAALAMHAYLEGHLSIDQLCCINLYLTCRQKTSDVKVHSLTNEIGQANLQEGFQHFFYPQDFESLFSQVDQDHEFFTVTYPLITAEEASTQIDNRSIDLFNLFHHSLDFPIGMTPNFEENILTVLVLPPALWRKMLAVRFQEQAIVLKPVLGYRSIEKLSNFNERVIGVPSPFLPVQSPIHESIAVDGIAFYNHDLLYHAYVESANPHREFWTKLALTIRDNPTIQDNKLIFQTLVDRNFPLYASPRLLQKHHLWMNNPSTSEIFWYSLPYLEFDSPDLKNWRRPIMEAILTMAEADQLPAGVTLETLLESSRDERKGCRCSLRPWLA